MQARMAALGLSIQDVADRAGVDRKTIYNAMHSGVAPSGITAHGIERALAWKVGSVDEVIHGGQPTNDDGIDEALTILASVDLTTRKLMLEVLRLLQHK